MVITRNSNALSGLKWVILMMIIVIFIGDSSGSSGNNNNTNRSGTSRQKKMMPSIIVTAQETKIDDMNDRNNSNNFNNLVNDEGNEVTSSISVLPHSSTHLRKTTSLSRQTKTSRPKTVLENCKEKLLWLHTPKTGSTLCMLFQHLCCPYEFLNITQGITLEMLEENELLPKPERSFDYLATSGCISFTRKRDVIDFEQQNEGEEDREGQPHDEHDERNKRRASASTSPRQRQSRTIVESTGSCRLGPIGLHEPFYSQPLVFHPPRSSISSVNTQNLVTHNSNSGTTSGNGGTDKNVHNTHNDGSEDVSGNTQNDLLQFKQAQKHFQHQLAIQQEQSKKSLLVTIIRHPLTRLLSSFLDSLHHEGLEEDLWQELVLNFTKIQDGSYHNLNLNGSISGSENVTSLRHHHNQHHRSLSELLDNFASPSNTSTSVNRRELKEEEIAILNYIEKQKLKLLLYQSLPQAKGCQMKMLIGLDCFATLPVNNSLPVAESSLLYLQHAKQILHSKFYVVGIFEEYSLSMKLMLQRLYPHIMSETYNEGGDQSGGKRGGGEGNARGGDHKSLFSMFFGTKGGDQHKTNSKSSLSTAISGKTDMYTVTSYPPSLLSLTPVENFPQRTSPNKALARVLEKYLRSIPFYDPYDEELYQEAMKIFRKQLKQEGLA